MQNDHRKELCDRFVTATASLYRLVYMGLLDDRKGLNEMVPQLRTVMLLADKGPMRVSHIAGFLGCTSTSMTYTLHRLVERKMIRKVPCPQDRRVVICELASEGRKVLEKIDHVVRNRVLPATDTWSQKQLEVFVESMEDVLDNDVDVP